MRLRGRRRELAMLDTLLRSVRAGDSRVLVLRGEAGAGKTALLDHLAAHTPPGLLTRAAGVEVETEIAYAALHQVCAPLLAHLDRLPEPQRDALATAFALRTGEPPQELVVGLGVLGLFAGAAATQPVICLVDDVQWLDPMSRRILAFVARRLGDESVALIFAVRSPGDETILTGLPELRVEGLPEADARALLESVLAGPVEPGVLDRIVAETRGNPLALLELPRGLSPAELAFGFGVRTAVHSPAPLAGRVEQGFQRRIATLPASTRTLLLTAALEPVGNVPLLWRAADRLGIPPEAAEPAQTAGLVDFGTRVRFRHPLVRSALWRSAKPAEIRAAHRALAEVTDPEREPDRRAWHRAGAAVGPDEQVAAELEVAAGRVLARGGRAAAAAFLERAAELTVDPGRRASRLLAAARARLDAGAPNLVPDLLAAAEMGPLDPLQRAGVQRMRAQIAFVLNPGSAAGPALLDAARRLETLDEGAARRTYLMAIGAALRAGRLGGDTLTRAAEAARRVRPADDFVGLMLAGLIAWTLDSHEAAVPLLRRAFDTPYTDEDLSLLWLTAPMAHEVFQVETSDRISEQALRYARSTGSVTALPAALVYRAGALMMMGRFGDAWELIDEAEAITGTTGLPFESSATLALTAYRGREEPALDVITAAVEDAKARGEGILIGYAGYAKALLYNSLGNYPVALAAARTATEYRDVAVCLWTLGELVEAATYTGDTAAAAEARDLITRWTAIAPTEWALGLRALAHALAGPPDRAGEHYREAADRFTACRQTVLAARTRLLHGEWLRRAGRRGEARTELRAAHEAFAVMGATAFAERARRELTASGEAVRGGPAGVRPGLTAQETQIARLAIAGRTNPEIGALLFLSPRTVEWHLRKVFAKLGIASRRELTAAMRDG
ncbi:helix-turn-helix domain-containing protein [Actinoplanes sp. TBRC 11911]|uniref:AAA family ATPase n=1 Tax=Actinoplanes sp. TBRC 11911 TaxID=2729386 RepID=UPI00145F05EA|nr:LuxR family transcriptional regulator [Actinoplanes sp. TBRC 11911]NMO54067.1 helix-turn-helix domain-containing protein [Actinoplanes sp. TBRC 11911]